ncbi:MAG: hypothetical protein ACREQJ_00010, partial [Candidatus Binatia bacterium]
EDVVAVFGVWLALEHPIVMLTLVVAFLVAAAILIPKILRALGTLFRKLTGRDRPSAPAAPTGQQVLPL